MVSHALPAPSPGGASIASNAADFDTTSNPPPDESAELRQASEINKKVPTSKKVLSSMVAGGVAGALAKTTIAPLDRTKINFQTSQRSFRVRKAIQFLADSYRCEGFSSLWRGNSATLARIIPYAGIQFAAHEQWKRLLATDRSVEHGFVHLDPARRFLAGSLAGTTAVTLTFPLDTVRARMAITRKQEYRGLVDAFRKMWRTEGSANLFRGFSAAMFGMVPYAGTSFFIYETLKKRYADYVEHRRLNFMERWMFGAIGGIMGQTSSYPIDIVRRRMQTSGIRKMDHVYLNLWSTFRFIWKTEGFCGLYKGWSMNLIKGPTAVGISFATFDHMLPLLRSFPFFQVDDDID